MSKTIAIFNQAGGVAKTTLTMNLGYHLGQHGHRVLLVDMDPQASLTTFMGLEPYELEPTIVDSLLKEVKLPIHRQIHGIDLLPANITLSSAEFQLASAIAREWKLKRALSSVTEDYDYTLIDCPPTLGILSILSLVAATHVLIPLQTHYKAYKGVDLLLDTIRQIREQVNPTLQIAGLIPTMYSNTGQDRTILEAVRQQLENVAPLYPAIPRAIAFADASMSHQPLALYDPKHPAVQILITLSKHLETL
ncbi:MAG TPA: ParA family protein [Thermosynechococcaceae cyanobacterium]